jgi:hypothetical protein
LIRPVNDEDNEARFVGEATFMGLCMVKPCELKAQQCKGLFSFDVKGVAVLISMSVAASLRSIKQARISNFLSIRR